MQYIQHATEHALPHTGDATTLHRSTTSTRSYASAGTARCDRFVGVADVDNRLACGDSASDGSVGGSPFPLRVKRDTTTRLERAARRACVGSTLTDAFAASTHTACPSARDNDTRVEEGSESKAHTRQHIDIHNGTHMDTDTNARARSDGLRTVRT